jgi:hypothetical protein
MFRTKVFGLAIALAGLLAVGSQAQAAFSLTLQQTGFANATANDNNVPPGTLTDLVGTTNVIGISGSYGTFTFNAITGVNSPGASQTMITSSVVTLTNTAGTTQTLTITVLDNAATLPSSPNSSLVAGLTVLNNTGAATATSTATATPPLTTTSTTIVRPVASIITDSTNSAFVLFTPGSSPFSLSNTVTVTLAAGASISLQASTTLTAAPAPQGLWLLVSALPLAFGGYFYRRRMTAAAAPMAA